MNEPEKPVLPLETSIGYNIRATHRLIQRALQAKIEPHGVTLGMWYFLRILWEQDGMTQSELSQLAETREPTTLSAIRDMERNDIVRRVPNAEDRRKINIFLTEKGQALRTALLPLAREVLDTAAQGLTAREATMLLGLLSCIRGNFQD